MSSTAVVGEAVVGEAIVGEAGSEAAAVTGPVKPPLELQAEFVFPDGTTARWDKDALVARNRPTGITFRTQRYTGFADAQFALARRIDLEYPDLALLAGVNLIGHDGSTAYEGRIATMPRMLQTAPSIGVQAQGWMSHAQDQTFTEIYVDRDLSRWGGMGIARRVARIAESYSVNDGTNATDEGGKPSVITSFPGPWVSPTKPLSEAWYDAGAGCLIGKVYYAWQKGGNTGTGGNWRWQTFLAGSDQGGGLAAGPELQAEAEGAKTLAATGIQRFAFFQFRFLETPSAPSVTYDVYWQPAVYGIHGLPVAEPEGPVVSAMIADIATRFAPKLTTHGVQATTFPVPQAVFREETKPYDAFVTLNAYHRWELAVYEDRELKYWPIDRTDYDWQIRTSDPGVTVSLQGDDVQNLCNGVVVRFTNILTGREERVTPATNSELRDPNPNNPATVQGLNLYTTLPLSVPTTTAGAIQMGRAFLAEFNEAQAPGSITITGHLRDRAGHYQQAWKVRASDRLVITDLPNESVRVVGETTWNHDSKQLVISVDSSAKRLDAVLARLGVAVEASGLHL